MRFARRQQRALSSSCTVLLLMAGPGLGAHGLETLDEFDEAVPLTKTYGRLLTEEQYEEQAAKTTEDALQNLLAHLDKNPNEYHRIMKKRRKEEAENRGIISFLKVG